MFETAFPADCVDFVGTGERGRSTLACGTYLLRDGATQAKEGAIELFEVGCDPGPGTITSRRAQRVAIPGAVFDLKWDPRGRGMLVVARSDGFLSVYSRADDSCTIRERPESSAECGCGAVTYVARLSASGGAVCCHGGGACSAWADTSGERGVGCGPLFTWQAHEFDAWVCCESASDPAGSVVWTGGDDGMLRGWDLRQRPSSATFSRRMPMGVTAIEWHPTLPLVAAGCYDESLTLWDPRQTRSPVSSIDSIGGGVWRLKWQPSPQPQPSAVLLAACMHAGFRLISVSSSSCPRIFFSRTDPHASLAYGACWAPPESIGRHDVAATCSFYDKKLSLWVAPCPST